MPTAGCGCASKSCSHTSVCTWAYSLVQSHAGAQPHTNVCTATRVCSRCTHDTPTRGHTHTEAQPRHTLARGCTNVRGCTTAPRHGYVTIARGCTPTRDTTTCGCTTTHNRVHTGSRTAAHLHAHLRVQLHVGPHVGTRLPRGHTSAHRCTAQAHVALHVDV